MPKYFLVLADDVDGGGEVMEILTKSVIRGLSLRSLKKKKVIPLAPPHIDAKSQQLLESIFALAETVDDNFYCEKMFEDILRIARKM